MTEEQFFIQLVTIIKRGKSFYVDRTWALINDVNVLLLNNREIAIGDKNNSCEITQEHYEQLEELISSFRELPKNDYEAVIARLR